LTRMRGLTAAATSTSTCFLRPISSGLRWQIANDLEHSGNHINAYTSKHETVFYAKVPACEAEKAAQAIFEADTNFEYNASS